ncbi:arabinosyltransferase domain-containing protein [Gordonia sp. NPDC003376]
MSATAPSPAPGAAPSASPASDDGRSSQLGARSGLIRLIAIVSGALGAILCAVVPLLPVQSTQASFDWPQGQPLVNSANVTAPLIAQVPRSLDISIPCRTLADLPAQGGLVLATMPTSAPGSKGKALYVSAGRDTVSVTFRNTLAASAPRADLGTCSTLHIWSSGTSTGARFVGLGPASDLDPGKRPQIDGVFTSLGAGQVRAADGLRVHIEIDNRYASSPTLLKRIVMILAVLCVVVALITLALLDRIHGHHRRIGPRPGLWAALRPRGTDLVVTGVLLVWLFLGAGSPDDGYVLTMGRTADSFGYLANYYRFYGIPEAPFDWYYAFLAHWASVSPSILWMHLPPMIAGLASWFILARVLLPRLGAAVRGGTSRVARLLGGGWPMWAAALTFLAFWMPFCSGLRSEPIIVLGSLLTWWAAERSIATRRMLPAALGAVAAGFTLALAPHGVIGVAILIVAARPLLRILVARRREAGLAALLAPLAAAGLLVLVVVFRDQTLATVLEAIKTRYVTGPIIGWHQEYLRYYFLTVSTKDGALTRRVPLLLLFAGLMVAVAVMLRQGRIRGVDGGPTWRLIGATGVTLLLFAFTPTKWTIQFGVFTGLGAAIAAVATVAVVQSAARSGRNLTVFVAGLLFALAAAMAGKNAWPFAYEYGISWFDRAPVLAGIPISTIFLALAVLAVAVAVWQHLRLDYVANRGLAHSSSGKADSAADRRRLFLASSPIAVIAGLMVASQLLVFAKAAVVRYPATTVLTENLNTLRGNTCGMADAVLVESDPNTGLLTPANGQSQTAALSGTGSGTTAVGFTPDGVPDDLSPEPGSARPGQMNVANPFSRPFVVSGGLGAGTTGGRGPTTVNGSTVALPYGLDPATTPVLGSYGATGEARLTTGWYDLPDRTASPLLVVAAAGAVATVDVFGVHVFGQKLTVQFGRPGADGSFEQIGPDVAPIDPGPIITNRPWRNLRVPMSAVPPAATVMRLSLLDNNLGEKQFLAITPPRAPRLQTLQQVVGSTAPTLVDFMVAAHFPCQQPLQVHHGVAEIPQWRILPDYASANSQSKTWQDADDGGLLAISEATTSALAVPTYLEDDWTQDWGALERLTPLVPDAAPARVATSPQTRWGWSRNGSIRVETSDDE